MNERTERRIPRSVSYTIFHDQWVRLTQIADDNAKTGTLPDSAAACIRAAIDEWLARREAEQVAPKSE